MPIVDSLSSPIRFVREEVAGPLAALAHPGWADRFPWLEQGTTTRRENDDFDLGLFSSGRPAETVRDHWSVLARATGFSDVVHARQLHGVDLHVVTAPPASAPARPGPPPRLLEPADGYATDRVGVLLTVSTADCVPVFIVDPGRRAVAAVHAGWRGAAAGILEGALRRMGEAFGTTVADVNVHLGPAICGSCYEVGPEVFEAFDEAPPPGSTPIDVRRRLAARALVSGVRPESISISTHCTRCTGSDLYSHRGGDARRQVGFVGVRPEPRS